MYSLAKTRAGRSVRFGPGMVRLRQAVLNAMALARRLAVGPFHQLGKGDLRGSASGAQVGDIDVEVADGVALETLAGGRVAGRRR